MSGIIRKIAAAAAISSIVVAAAGSPAWADDDDERDERERRNRPVLVKERAATVMAGTSSWVNVLWAGDGAIDDFSITAEARDGVTVSYSETTGDHAGPMNGYALDDLETDFTGLKITVPESFSKKTVRITLNAQWTTPDGRRQGRPYQLRVPVVHHDGSDWKLVDDSAPVGTGWVEIPVVGLAPASDDLQFSLATDPGLEVYLPQGAWTGPHHDSSLDAGESDVLRFHVDPASVTTDHELTFVARWTRGDEAKSIKVPFTVVAG